MGVVATTADAVGGDSIIVAVIVVREWGAGGREKTRHLIPATPMVFIQR
jgi:hypothetical protein